MEFSASVGGSDYTLKALSLSGCSLADRDLQVVFAAIRQGLPLHMVKLSSNRITSAGVRDLVDALLSFTSHPLKLIDLHNNRVGCQTIIFKLIILTLTDYRKSLQIGRPRV